MKISTMTLSAISVVLVGPAACWPLTTTRLSQLTGHAQRGPAASHPFAQRLPLEKKPAPWARAPALLPRRLALKPTARVLAKLPIARRSKAMGRVRAVPRALLQHEQLLVAQLLAARPQAARRLKNLPGLVRDAVRVNQPARGLAPAVDPRAAPVVPPSHRAAARRVQARAVSAKNCSIRPPH